MKIRNKKTGEIFETMNIGSTNERGEVVHSYSSLAELNEDWEDYKEPKEYWYIGADGEVFCEPSDNRCSFDMDCEQIGNYFGTKEEAEQAVKKLKAWKRLKDKGFRFDGYDVAYTYNSNGDLCGQLFCNAGNYCIEDVEEDLDLLFSGEDD